MSKPDYKYIYIYIYIYAQFLRILEFRGQKQHDKEENLMKDNTLSLIIMCQITFDKITFLHILGPNNQSHGMNSCRNSVPNSLRCLRPNLWLELYLQACSDSDFFTIYKQPFGNVMWSNSIRLKADIFMMVWRTISKRQLEKLNWS